VEEGGDDEIGVGVASPEQPAGGVRAVDDVAGMLALEERQQARAKPLAGEGKVVVAGAGACFPELADAVGDHVRNSRVPGATVRMNQRMGLYWGATNPTRMKVISIPIP
jgi:hypothetical protein